MRLIKKFFVFLIIALVVGIIGLIIYRHVIQPHHCLSPDITVQHPDYVKCGPIVAQELLAKAKNGDAQAAYKLALMYDAGDRIPENRQEAIAWLQKAEQANLADAQYVMAVWSERRYFGPASADLTLPMYEAAARQGHLNAMKSLANIYFDKDKEKYDYWMKKIRKHK